MDPIAKFLGAWSQELNGYSIVLRIVLPFFLSAIIGCERSSKRHSAGRRTFICISWFPAAEKYFKNRSNHFEVHWELKDTHYLQNFVSTILKK